MIPVAELYPKHAEDERRNGHFYGPSNYGPLLESFGYEILVQVDDADYQGDSRLLYKNGDQYGILVFGWGSCSGCDALQGCDHMSEIEELQRSLYEGIHWGTAEEILAYIDDKDWQGSASWHAGKEELPQFIAEVRQHLGGGNEPV